MVYWMVPHRQDPEWVGGCVVIGEGVLLAKGDFEESL